MRHLRAAVLAALSLIPTVCPAPAADVTLTSRDGTVEVEGDLLGYDGEFYRVDTVYGVLTVDGSGVVCEGPGCPDLTAFVARFTFSGARTMGEVLLPSLVEAFAARAGYLVERQIIDDTHFAYILTDQTTGAKAAEIGFRVTSTEEGFADLLANETDIVLSTRPVNATEVRLAREAGLGDLSDPRRSKILALDAMAVIVSAENPMQGLTLSQIARIFSGEIADWSDLGGPEAPIAVHLRGEDSGLAQAFDARLLAPREKAAAEGTIRHDSNRELADAVADDPLAIGIAPYSETGNARVLDIYGTCGMVSVLDELTVKTEDYPLTLPLFVYTPARRLPLLAREFLKFARSPAAQYVVSRANFVDLRLYRVPVAEQGHRLVNAIAEAGDEIMLDELQRLVRAMEGTERLTLSFRFEPGGTQLDAQSRSNVEVLAQQIESGQFDYRPLIFVGFSDSEGPADGNERLSGRRAAAVRDAVLDAAPTADRDKLVISVDAFGEAMPMACDDAEWGREINRRVEVWTTQR
ncbi:phosphate ABC transporter substrate-binding/OmpA family protein [Psychromarinibacter sp. C21-152]|uniref:Phosphate ABC transporter substrate-binding/OmpA family protein n=1 Tax=Psychromarinibacter sediminicola TaxID=3033385 RepID=A0AAE3NT74_9RHOB|nr:phosphate ABC transporter substrate-binding/OmpA family protein [Psychromarinibacter sediminicola]MDF0601632.1 phosphate ABC transporter substrate-binding/OmpA family protein [Psychromarinibacter sediminicola]